MSNIILKDLKRTKELRKKCTKFFELEKPYGWMIEELVNSLYEKNTKIQGNYLTALGLFCYSEVVGREIMRFKYPNKFKDPNKKEGSKNSKKYFNLRIRKRWHRHNKRYFVIR